MRGMSAGCSRCLHAAVAVVCMTLCVVEGDTEGAGLVSRMNQMESEAGIPSEGKTPHIRSQATAMSLAAP